MKNVFKFLGIIALVAVIGFSMIACGGNDTTNDDNTDDDLPFPSVTYTSTFEAEGKTHTVTLVITSAVKVAAYTPKANDPWEMRIGEGRFAGKVKSVSGSTYDLGRGSTGSGQMDMVVTITNSGMTRLEFTQIDEDGTSGETVAYELTPS